MRSLRSAVRQQVPRRRRGRAAPFAPTPYPSRARLVVTTGLALITVIPLMGLTGCGGERTPIPELPPARSALSEPEPLAGWRRSAIDAVLEARVLMGARSGYVALVARDGRLVHARTAGYQDVSAEIPMAMDTRFQLASMTKPIVAAAAMMLVEEGRLGLDDPVSDFLPAFGAMSVAVRDDGGAVIGRTPQTERMRIRHLLSFSSGIGGNPFDKSPLGLDWRENGLYAGDGSLAERVDRLASFPLFEQPGTRWRYGASLDVMGRIIELVAEQPLDRFLEQRIFTPLGMHATRYAKDTQGDVPLARMYTQNEDGDLVADEGPLYQAPDWTPGGSGLVGTATDYMRFALMLWNEGEYDGVRILAPETVRRMRALEVPSGVLDVMDVQGLGFGLGVSVVADADAALMPARNGDFWWSGAYGTHFWVSPETGIVLVVLQQNKMSEHGGTPVAPFLVQQFALVDRASGVDVAGR